MITLPYARRQRNFSTVDARRQATLLLLGPLVSSVSCRIALVRSCHVRSIVNPILHARARTNRDRETKREKEKERERERERRKNDPRDTRDDMVAKARDQTRMIITGVVNTSLEVILF